MNEQKPKLLFYVLILAMTFAFAMVLLLDRTNAQETKEAPKYKTNTYYLTSEMTEPEDIIDFYETAYKDQIDRTLDWIDRYRDLKERCGI